MRSERGSMTLWAMGMSMLLFAVGFLALDLWSGFAARPFSRRAEAIAAKSVNTVAPYVRLIP